MNKLNKYITIDNNIINKRKIECQYGINDYGANLKTMSDKHFHAPPQSVPMNVGTYLIFIYSFKNGANPIQNYYLLLLLKSKVMP